MREKSIQDIIERVSIVTYDKSYKNIIKQAQNNWLELSADEVIEDVMKYLRSLATINV